MACLWCSWWLSVLRSEMVDRKTELSKAWSDARTTTSRVGQAEIIDASRSQLFLLTTNTSIYQVRLHTSQDFYREVKRQDISLLSVLWNYTMRFRASIENVPTFFREYLTYPIMKIWSLTKLRIGIVQAIEKLQKKCIIKFSETEMSIICNNDANEGGIQVWSWVLRIAYHANLWLTGRLDR